MKDGQAALRLILEASLDIDSFLVGISQLFTGPSALAQTKLGDSKLRHRPLL